ncbi:MAG: hypothetical protein ACPL7M_03330 [Bryobacteraceae bacterium]
MQREIAAGEPQELINAAEAVDSKHTNRKPFLFVRENVPIDGRLKPAATEQPGMDPDCFRL